MERRRLTLPRLTHRLTLRAPDPRDAAAVQQAIEESFESLQPWMPWAIRLPSLHDTTAFLERARADFLNGEDFGVTAFLRDGGRFVLGSGLHPRGWDVPKFEIGYWCRSSLQGGGLTTETVEALAEAAFDEMGARRVEIRADARNRASHRVAERAGFTLEAALKNDDRANDGSLRDTLVFVRLATDAFA